MGGALCILFASSPENINLRFRSYMGYTGCMGYSDNALSGEALIVVVVFSLTGISIPSFGWAVDDQMRGDDG